VPKTPKELNGTRIDLGDVPENNVGNGTITKTAGGRGWTAGATSTDRISADGYVEWTVANNLANRQEVIMAGLARPNDAHSYTSLDYTWYTSDGIGALYIYERGGKVGQFGNWNVGDKLKVERVGNRIKYYHNGVLKRDVATSISGDLVFDVAMYDQGARIESYRMVNNYWLAYVPDVVSVSDYYPFGMQIAERSWSAGDGYRFAFNGKEMDNEVSGSGNSYDYGFRIYNPRLGKFLSVDPLFKSYPWYTPYQFAGNRPIAAIDLDGLEEYYPEINYGTDVTLGTEAGLAARNGVQGLVSGAYTIYSAVGSVVWKMAGDLRHQLGIESTPSPWRTVHKLEFDNPDGSNSWTPQIIPVGDQPSAIETAESIVNDAIDVTDLLNISPIPTNPKDLVNLIGNTGLDYIQKEVQKDQRKASTISKSSSSSSESNTHTIKKGDILGQLALDYNTTIDNLVSLNKIKDKDKIKIGDTLKLE
tara:strand:+ start:5611 stop:7035 length:1425 start_codon:yes stop_codon:yes gene_type:complete